MRCLSLLLHSRCTKLDPRWSYPKCYLHTHRRSYHFDADMTVTRIPLRSRQDRRDQLGVNQLGCASGFEFHSMMRARQGHFHFRSNIALCSDKLQSSLGDQKKGSRMPGGYDTIALCHCLQINLLCILLRIKVVISARRNTHEVC